jgi:methylmalonyl-CoA mutase C-terminal domain/subunit
MRPLRILITIMGLDQHEVGAVAVSRLLRDAGMEVIYTGRFNLPERVARTAIDEDVDVVGLSCHSWEYLYYVDELLGLLSGQGAAIPLVVGGSVVTPSDAAALKERGVADAFGPTATPAEIVATISALGARKERV